MEASIENMRACEARGIRPVAYSPSTGEEYSANPADYWNAPNDWVMKDADGVPMFLVIQVITFEEVTP